jgi:hypothetical protein
MPDSFPHGPRQPFQESNWNTPSTKGGYQKASNQFGYQKARTSSCVYLKILLWQSMVYWKFEPRNIHQLFSSTYALNALDLISKQQ